MPAYLIAETKSVSNPEQLGEYAKLAGPTLQAYGAKVLAAGPCETLEGDWQPNRVIVIEFESAEKLKAWYESPEYQAVLPMRIGASETNAVILGV